MSYAEQRAYARWVAWMRERGPRPLNTEASRSVGGDYSLHNLDMEDTAEEMDKLYAFIQQELAKERVAPDD